MRMKIRMRMRMIMTMVMGIIITTAVIKREGDEEENNDAGYISNRWINDIKLRRQFSVLFNIFIFI